MRIIHHPNGTHPYVKTGYQRDPLQPIIGENVQVSALVVEPVGSVSASLTLCYGDKCREISGQQYIQSEDDRLFFSFSLGELEESLTYRYIIHTQDDQESSQSNEFIFDALQRIPLGNPITIQQNPSDVVIHFEHISLRLLLDHELCLQWEANDRSIQGINSISIDDKVMLAAGELELIIQRHPFSWILKRLGKRVVTWLAEDVSLLIDSLSRVHGLETSPKLNGERFYGLGERFDGVQQLGKKVDLRVVEKFSNQGEFSYLPIPYLFTDNGAAWIGMTWRRLIVDLHQGFTYRAATAQRGLLFKEYFLAGQPLELLSALHKLTGTPALPPKWVFGVWISSNGWNTQHETLEQVAILQRYALPATALVLEAWSDEKTFYIFNDAQYEPFRNGEKVHYGDFTFPKDGKWPDPKAMAQQLEQLGISIVLWQIPVIKYAWEGPNDQLLLDEQYAIENGYCVLNEDGSPYRITDGWFSQSLLLDFSNPQACDWWFSKRNYLLDDIGVKGFKTDGGEFLFEDSAKIYDGQLGETAHNAYPGQYIGAYHDFLIRKQVNGVCFSRAGYLGAQTQPLHWAGDQLSQWTEFRAQLSAGLSAGISGIPFWSFDIGGFAGEFPNKQLYLRSVALGAFCPVMQWHSEPRNGQFFVTDRTRWNNDRSPWNLAEYHKDEQILTCYRRFANLRMSLIPYLYQEAIHCVLTGRPMMAHLMVDEPEDPTCLVVEDQYMLGRNLLVAPILEENVTHRDVYLPKGKWHELFTGKCHQGPGWVTIPCGLDEVPVFAIDGCALPLNLSSSFTLGGDGPECFVGNQMDCYQQLALLCFGHQAIIDFKDDLGYSLKLGENGLQGNTPHPVLLIDALMPGEEVLIFGRKVAAQLVQPCPIDEETPD